MEGIVNTWTSICFPKTSAILAKHLNALKFNKYFLIQFEIEINNLTSISIIDSKIISSRKHKMRVGDVF